MKKTTKGPTKTRAYIDTLIDEVEALEEYAEDLQEEIDKLKDVPKREFIILENATLQKYRWRASHVGPVPDV